MELRWIKIRIDLFDNRKIKQIEALPDGDTIIVIWVKLLCLAGTVNDSGLIYLTKDIPYTDEMLAQQFGRPLSTIKLALDTFQRFGMIEVVDDVMLVSNWEKYQAIEKHEERKEYNRLAQQRHRAMLKGAGVIDMSLTSQQDVSKCQQTDKDKDKDKDTLSCERVGARAQNKEAYGEYKNVLLYPAEKEKLYQDFPNEAAKYIEILSEYLHQHPEKSYAYHASIIKTWINQDRSKCIRQSKEKPRYGDFDPEEMMKRAIEKSFNS